MYGTISCDDRPSTSSSVQRVQKRGKADALRRFSYEDADIAPRSLYHCKTQRGHSSSLTDLCSDGNDFIPESAKLPAKIKQLNDSEHLPRVFEAVTLDGQTLQDTEKASVQDRWQEAVANMEREKVIQEKIGLLINGRYKVLLKISFGTYGSIYSAHDTSTGKKVAIKFVNEAYRPSNVQLQREYDVCNALRGLEGIPEVYWFGTEFDYQILVMQLLGPSLAQLYSYCDHWFTTETIKKLGEQMLCRLRSLHSSGYVHRDVKPENFLMGIGKDEQTCYLIDFGLVRRYRCANDVRMHIPQQIGNSLVGTAKYASISSHKGMTLSRRDDLESLGYILIEFINRSLPWTVKVEHHKRGKRVLSKKQSYSRIRIMKERTNWAIVCPQMASWVSYCTHLGFSDEPDYDHLNDILQSISATIDESPEKRRLDQAVRKTQNSVVAEPHRYSFSSAAFGSRARRYIPGNFDDGTNRFSWIMRRESSVEERDTFYCLYRWMGRDERVDAA